MVNRKTISIIFLLVFMAIPTLLQACQQASSDLQVVSLNIEPPKVLVGERATIRAQVKNINGKTVTYNVPLMVNGIAEERTSVTLPAGATEAIEFSLIKYKPGKYIITIGESDYTLEVQEPPPPDFKLSQLEINPTIANTGQKIVITAKIANIGGIQGSYTAELKINGVTNKTEELTLAPGTDHMMVFTVSMDLPGIYTVALGELTGQFVINEPQRPVVNNPQPPPPPPTHCSPGG